MENSYNPTTSAFKPIYDKLKHFADNPLVKQFSLKSFNEIVAAEHSFEKKLAKLDVNKNKEKVALYKGVLETLEMLQIQSINFTADLMFESEESIPALEVHDAVEITDEDEKSKEHGPATKEVKSKLDVVHNATKSEKDSKAVVDSETNLSAEDEIEEGGILQIPAWELEDKDIKAQLHEAVESGAKQEELINWLKILVDKKMFKEGSRILRNLEKGEFSDERYAHYAHNFIINPAKKETEDNKETKSEATLLELPEEPISFNKMKNIVKLAFKGDIAREVIDNFVRKMIDEKLIKKGGSDKVNTKKAREDWLTNVEKGVEMSRKAQEKAEKAVEKQQIETKPNEPIFDEDIEQNQPSKELLTACENAEKELKAGNRDNAVGIIKHYLGEYGGEAKGAFTDIDIQRLLNWIDEGVFHHRNPMDLLYNIPLSITDVIKEVERLSKLEGKSRKDIQNLIYSKIEGVKLREFESQDEAITNIDEFNKWFESTCGAIFRDEKVGNEFSEQKQFEEDFEKSVKKMDGSTHKNVTTLIKEYKEGVKKYGSVIRLNAARDYVLSKLEVLNPVLFETYKKWKEESTPAAALPAASESSTKESDSKESDTKSPEKEKEDNGASEAKKENAFSKEHPKVWKKTDKLKSLEGLTNFILKHQDLGSAALYGLAREIITAGQIEDAVTEFEAGKPVQWDLTAIGNWFRMGPEKILESHDLFEATSRKELVRATNRYISRYPKFEQEEYISKLKNLLVMNVSIRTRFVAKFVKHKNFEVELGKLFEETLQEKFVSTT